MFDIYVVKEDDTLNNIANKFNLSPNIIKQFNGYDIDIVPGMSLFIPKANNKYFSFYMVNKGDTLYKIANNSNINPTLLAELNGINLDDYIYPNQVLLVPRAGSILYFTGIGDTLGEVAKGLNTDIASLVKENANIYLQPEQLIVYRNK